MSTDAPIGVFDSGVGGLTVARALLDQLPGEPLLYVGDTAHGPYGPLPIADVRRHALEAMDALVSAGVKVLVIACNSASSACLRDARERYGVPVVEVIQPAVRRAVAASRNGRVGLLATQVTVASRAYDDAFAAAPQVSLTSAACPRFVDFVERGVTTGRQLLQLATHYLDPVQRADVDTVVLGCTHYPLLTGMISLVMGDGVTLVSSAEETAKDVYRVLAQSGLGRDPEAPPPVHRFLATGDPEPFARLGRRFLGPEIGQVSRMDSRAGAWRLTVLGCAGTFPGPDSPCSAYLVEHEGFRLVVDLGAGALGMLQRHIDLLDVDAIYISHLHADHCIDLVAYSYARRFHPDGIPPQVPVYGPAGMAERICASFETPPPDGLLDVFDFREVPVGEQQIGPFTVRTVRSNHPVECHAIRVEAGGRSLTYSGDTGVSDDVVELARGTDLFLCEASWTHSAERPPDVHLSGREAGEHAELAEAGRLLVTHMVAWADVKAILAEARAAFGGDVEPASCGATFTV